MSNDLIDKLESSYDSLLDGVISISKKYIIITGVVDVRKVTEKFGQHEHTLKKIENFNEESYWVIIGNPQDEMIIETMSELDCDDVDKEGEYEFHAVLTWMNGDYDEYGRCTMRDYLDVDHLRWNLIQTFEQRERQFKLDQILEDDFNKIFNI